MNRRRYDSDRRPLARAARAGLCASLLGGLAACESVEAVNDFFTNPIVLACPDFSILADASSMTNFRSGPGRDLVDVDFQGRMIDLSLACKTNIDKETRVGSMDVEVRTVFAASRGPANKTRRAQVPYFITVTDVDQKVLYKEKFQVAIGFPGNTTAIQFRGKPVTLELPLTEKVTGKNYHIYGGLQLSREQLEFNRRRRASTNR